MKVTKETIEHISELARLNISEAEKDKMVSEMEKIISYVDKLDELDTSGVEPMEHVLPMHNVFREDEVKNSFSRDKLLECAPSHEKGCYRVPKVVE